MWAVRVHATLLAAGLTLSASLLAQTAPVINLPPGDAARGKAIFEGNKGNCRSCHRVGGVGSLFGPDLSTIGSPPRGGGGGRGGGGANAAAGRGEAAGGARGAVPAFGGDEVANARIAADAAAAATARGAQGATLAPAPTQQQQLAQSILDPNAVVTVQNRYVQLKMKDGKTISGKLLSVDTFAYQILDSTEKLANISKTDIRDATMTSPMPSYRGKLTDQELSDVVSYLMTLKGQ